MDFFDQMKTVLKKICGVVDTAENLQKKVILGIAIAYKMNVNVRQDISNLLSKLEEHYVL